MPPSPPRTPEQRIGGAGQLPEGWLKLAALALAMGFAAAFSLPSPLVYLIGGITGGIDETVRLGFIAIPALIFAKLALEGRERETGKLICNVVLLGMSFRLLLFCHVPVADVTVTPQCRKGGARALRASLITSTAH